MNLLILIADIDEFNPCKKAMGDLVKKEYKLKHMPAFDFTYSGHDCTAVCFGIGKVNAAMGAAIALNEKEYHGVINTGWSGAVSGLFKGDIVVSESVTECDFDLTPLGKKLGQKPEQAEYIYDCKNFLFDGAISVNGFKSGKLGTGDFFLTDTERREKYKEIFDICAFDMESGALGASCYLLGNIPFVSIRKISDNANDVGTDDYKTSVKTDITAFSDIVLKVLEKI